MTAVCVTDTNWIALKSVVLPYINLLMGTLTFGRQTNIYVST